MEQPLFILSLVSLIWEENLYVRICKTVTPSRFLTTSLQPPSLPILTDHSLSKSGWVGPWLGRVTSIPLLWKERFLDHCSVPDPKKSSPVK